MGLPSNKVQWQPTIPVNQSIYEDSTTQKAPLGTRLEVGDRVFFYAQASASVARGLVLCAQTPVASHNGALCTLAATSAGVTTPTITAGSAITANQYAEGYMGISKGTQGGAMYRIKSNPAIGSGASGTVTLYDALIDDVAAADEVGLIRNNYSLLEVGSQLLGLPVCQSLVDVTASGYFWGQTYGPTSVKNEVATPAGAVLHLGTGGAVSTLFDATTNGGNAGVAYQIGKNYSLAGTSGEYTPVLLDIRP